MEPFWVNFGCQVSLTWPPEPSEVMVSLQRGTQITKSTLSFTVEYQGQQNQTILVQGGFPRAQHDPFEVQIGALGRYVFCTFSNFGAARTFNPGPGHRIYEMWRSTRQHLGTVRGR